MKGKLAMDKHITLVGILNLAYRSLVIIGGLVLIALAVGFRYLMELVSRSSHQGMEEIPEAVFDIAPIVLGIIGILIIIVSIMGIIGAIGVMKKKEWGRIVLLVISFFNILHVPLGTLLGVYTLWVLFNDETIKLFNPVIIPPVDKTTG
jgi:hypothetical protein